jgi:hypothetical protein
VSVIFLNRALLYGANVCATTINIVTVVAGKFEYVKCEQEICAVAK